MSHRTTSAHGIYLHMPWCASLCPYCAFYKVVEARPDHASWVKGICRDWEHWAPAFTGPVHSVYFGGGTPSLAPPEVIRSVLERIPWTDETEISLEVNPGSIDARGLECLRQIGITRLSLGIQSLEPDLARFLARGHSARQGELLLHQVAGMGYRSWSADLIFAVPGQTLEMLERDLDALLEAGVPHISLYGLTIEPGTAFARAQMDGTLVLPGEDLWVKLYTRIQDRMKASGFEQYEVSNFALPGHRSVHNGSVWRGGAYAGLGPSAHGFAPDGRRWANPPDLKTWLAGPPPKASILSRRESAMDYILSSLRHVEGVDLEVLALRSGMRPSPSVVEQLISADILHLVHPQLQLSSRGLLLADGVVGELCGALEPVPDQDPQSPTDLSHTQI